MLPKLEIDALRADLAAIDSLLVKAQAFDDAIGQVQFARRKEQLLKMIADLEGSAERTGKMAIFFGGQPVIGSKGVEADFAGNALAAFQEIIDKRMANSELGSMGTRGPVPLKRSAQLMVTDVVRGSFGFVLEEATAEDALTDTELKVVIDKVARMISEVAAADEERFEAALVEIDSRMLGGLRRFFSVLDDRSATLRLVHEHEERSFARSDIRRGRARIDRTEIEESETTDVIGLLLGLLPEHRKFELRRTDTGETIYGAVDASLTKRMLGDSFAIDNPIGRTWRTRLSVRVIHQPGRPDRFAYVLKELIEESFD